MIQADMILSIVEVKRPYFSGFVRPFIVATFNNSVRHNFMELLKDLRESLVVLFFIFLFVFIYANIGKIFYRSSYEGYSYFSDLPTAYYNMLILLTTANFPDVMLPAYY